MMDWKLAFGIIGATITIYSYIPYYISIFKGTTKPHVFSWLIWGLSAGIAFAAQLYNHAGVGIVVTGAACVLATSVAIVALKRGEKYITKTDWLFFLMALSAIPLWLVTDEPLWAAMLVALVDSLGFAPSVRKSWNNPYSENAGVFLLTGFQYIFSVLAISHYDLTNLVYPATLIVVSFGFTFILYSRRLQLKGLAHAA